MAIAAAVFTPREFKILQEPLLPAWQFGALTDTIASPDRYLSGALDSLFRFEKMPPGWSGKNSRPASHALVVKAAHFLKSLVPEIIPDVMLLDDGGILFEWTFDIGTAQLEFSPDGSEEYSVFTNEDDAINAFFVEPRWFYGGRSVLNFSNID